MTETILPPSLQPGDTIGIIHPASAVRDEAAFEVGPEVRENFGPWGQIESLFQVNKRGRLQADLFGLARARLHKNGVLRAYGGGICTFDDPQRFYSYRRDGDTGRMLSFIYRS